MGETHKVDAAWQEVTSAGTAEAQRRHLDAFLALNAEIGAPPLQVSVKELASGARVPISKALWANPQNYEVTLRYEQRTYTFTPKSAASLEPLFNE